MTLLQRTIKDRAVSKALYGQDVSLAARARGVRVALAQHEVGRAPGTCNAPELFLDCVPEELASASWASGERAAREAHGSARNPSNSSTNACESGRQSSGISRAAARAAARSAPLELRTTKRRRMRTSLSTTNS